jgi:hypothetical protein
MVRACCRTRKRTTPRRLHRNRWALRARTAASARRGRRGAARGVQPPPCAPGRSPNPQPPTPLACLAPPSGSAIFRLACRRPQVECTSPTRRTSPVRAPAVSSSPEAPGAALPPCKLVVPNPATTTPCHHHAMPPPRHATTTPCHHHAMPPPRHVTTTPCHHHAMPPPRHLTTTPCHHYAMPPPRHLTTTPCSSCSWRECPWSKGAWTATVSSGCRSPV